MSYIPKSVKRKLDRVNTIKSANWLKPEQKAELLGSPLSLNEQVYREVTGVPNVLRQGQSGSGMWDVYLDGVKQHLCQEANAMSGYVIRYTHGSGRTPLTKQTEKVRGKVEFVRKGSKLHQHTDECWEPNGGCDMGRNENHVKVSAELGELNGQD